MSMQLRYANSELAAGFKRYYIVKGCDTNPDTVERKIKFAAQVGIYYYIVTSKH